MSESLREEWGAGGDGEHLHEKVGEDITSERQLTDGRVLDTWMQKQANKCAVHG